MSGILTAAYRRMTPLPVRDAIYRLRNPAPQKQVSPPAPPEVIPSVLGLLDRPRTQRLPLDWLSDRPWIALYMNSNCSHGCVYCVSGMQDRAPRTGLLEQLGVDEYARLLLKLAGNHKVRFNFAGPGECAEHKDFVPLLQKLLDDGHHAVIQSHGLSSKTIAKALSKYSRDDIANRVRLHLSFHLAAYLDDKDTRRLDAYADQHIRRIAGLGAPIYLIVPLSPKVLRWQSTEDHLAAIKSVVDQEGGKLVYQMVEFHGAYEGRYFPAGYDREEQRLFAYYMDKYGNPSRGEDYGASAADIGRVLYLKGMPCYAHVLISEVMPDGTIRHCQAEPADVVGNLTDELTIANLIEPKPCPFNKCCCISVGYNMSLEPLGISMSEYATELKRVKG